MYTNWLIHCCHVDKIKSGPEEKKIMKNQVTEWGSVHLLRHAISDSFAFIKVRHASTISIISRFFRGRNGGSTYNNSVEGRTREACRLISQRADYRRCRLRFTLMRRPFIWSLTLSVQECMATLLPNRHAPVTLSKRKKEASSHRCALIDFSSYVAQVFKINLSAL